VADAQEQVRYLDNMDVPVCVDELALDYDCIAGAATDMFDQGEIDAKQFGCVRSLNQKLSEMSGPGNARLWREDALFGSPEWEHLREAAKRCLSLLSQNRVRKLTCP
jgi:hypothetical protein